MKDLIESFVAAAKSKQWQISLGDPQDVELPDAITNRYARIPEDYLEFLSRTSLCCNQPSNAWFFCVDDYKRRDEEGWHWNDYEKMSLDVCDGDEELAEDIEEFWNDHFPIAYAVHSGHAYLALSVSPDDFGAVFYGYGPEFEEASRVCDTFPDFLSNLTNFLSGAESVEYKDEDGGDCILREYSDFM